MLKPLPPPGYGLGDKMPQYIVALTLTLTIVIGILWYVAFVFSHASRAGLPKPEAEQTRIEAGAKR